MLSKAIMRSPLTKTLASVQKRSIMYSNGQPYDKRWQWSFNNAYYCEPEENDPVGRPKPEDSKTHGSYMGTFKSHFERRFKNIFTLLYARRERLYNPFDLFVLPISTMFFLQFWDLHLGFKGFSMMLLLSMITRARDRVMDPQCPETYLREMIHKNEALKKYFAVETMQTMDFDFQYIPGYPNMEEFPEFDNKLFSSLIRIL